APERRAERERPGRVHAAAVRREQAEPPVADLVAESLDDDRAVGRQRPRRSLLLAEIRDQVARRELVAAAARPQARLRRLVVECRELAAVGAERGAELRRPRGLVAVPEGDRAGRPGCRRDQHTIARDLLDAPGRGAEQEDLALARLVDHLLVQLADAAAAV